MDNVTTMALKEKGAVQKQNKMKKAFRKFYATATAAMAMASLCATTAFADWESANINNTGTADASGMMSKVIGVLLTITRYVGVALTVYGVYEIVMSFMQNQPEAKTKGIVMALSGVVMIGLKSILVVVGVLNNGASAAA